MRELLLDTSGTARETRRAQHLFAAFLGLAVLMIIARFFVLEGTPYYEPYLLLLIYQDILVLAVVAWTFHGLLRLTAKQSARRIVFFAGWTVCLIAGGYTAIDLIVYRAIRSPLTYRLLVISQGGEGIGGSIRQAVTAAALDITDALLIVLLTAEAVRRCAPSFLAKTSRAFFSRSAVALLVVYFVCAHAWVLRHVNFPNAVENPEWALLSSLFDRSKPLANGNVPRSFLKDFRTPSKAPNRAPEASLAVTLRSQLGSGHRPLNVVMVIMESVGVRRLGVYGAPYNNSPTLSRLAPHSIFFERMYASQANTSSAMAALFCSLYPQHAWETVPRKMPELPVEGFPGILVRRGYRTAFIHAGQVSYDHRGDFLRDHGFETLATEAVDRAAPSDTELLPRAGKWLKGVGSKPFFLTIWTLDTHHPYEPSTQVDFKVHDQALDRYLSGIYSTDRFIGQLEDQLRRLHLADNTLLVITGDHGESFGQHGWLVHGFTVYEAETHIPLMIFNPRIRSRVNVDGLGRQIDIAPTILDILGIQAPAQWQGMSLLNGKHPERAYLFAADGGFTFGMVEGKFKYIYKLDENADELYDLSRDPFERYDLSSEPAYQEMVKLDQLHLQAWLNFQNKYLARLSSPGSAAPARAAGVARSYSDALSWIPLAHAPAGAHTRAQ